MKGAFLVNPSRSGSTMMSTILRQHPDVLSLSELLTNQGARALLPGTVSGAAFWKQLAKPSALMRHMVNPESAPREFLYHHVENPTHDAFNCPPLLAVTLPHLFKDPDAVFRGLAPQVAQFPDQTRADHLRGLIALLAQQTAQEFWVERSGGTLFATQTLARQFPDARFALILRDGRDVVLSMQKYKPARFLVWFWKLAGRFGVNVFAPQSQIGSARWIALTEKLSGRFLPVQRILNKTPSLQDTAACWSAMIQSGLPQFAAIPTARRYVMRYETVVQNPRAELQDFAAFLDLPQNDRWLAQSSQIPRALTPRYLSLPTDQQEALTRYTQEARELADAFY